MWSKQQTMVGRHFGVLHTRGMLLCSDCCWMLVQMHARSVEQMAHPSALL